MLFDSWNEGVGFVNYVGHGALETITTDGLMDSSDVPGLSNVNGPSVLTAMTCMIGRFDVPGFTSLGEELVRKAEGGAVVVWAPTGLSANSKANLLNDRFFRVVFHSQEEVLGDAIRRTFDSFRGADSARPTLQLFQLLGDPALKMTIPPVTPELPGPGGGGNTI